MKSFDEVFNRLKKAETELLDTMTNELCKLAEENILLREENARLKRELFKKTKVLREVGICA